MGASPTGSTGAQEAPLSVKSAGASPPQMSDKYLHINLGNQYRAGGSLPNVNDNAKCSSAPNKDTTAVSVAIDSIDFKVRLFTAKPLYKNGAQ